MGGSIHFQGKGTQGMNIYIVREQDMERVEVFTSRKLALLRALCDAYLKEDL